MSRHNSVIRKILFPFKVAGVILYCLIVGILAYLVVFGGIYYLQKILGV